MTAIYEGVKRNRIFGISLRVKKSAFFAKCQSTFEKYFRKFDFPLQQDVNAAVCFVVNVKRYQLH